MRSNDEKLTHERSAYEATRPFGKVDMVRDILNQQSVSDDCSAIETEFDGMNETTEMFSIQSLKIRHTQKSGKAYAPPRRQWATKLKVLFVQTSNPVPREEQKTVETKQKETLERKVSFGVSRRREI